MQSVFEQDLERLVKQYDQPGPHYTSYPTVPVWPQGSFGREYAEALEAEGTKDRGISIYLHIPFCRTLCTFCGCNKVITRDAELVERYLKALEQEMAAVAKGLGQRKTLSQLHLGGGTPTFLSLDQLTRLTEMLKHHFEIDPEGEWALEANPRVTTAEQLEGLFDLGFRRVSFGIQDINPAVKRHQPQPDLHAIRESLFRFQETRISEHQLRSGLWASAADPCEVSQDPGCGIQNAPGPAGGIQFCSPALDVQSS